MQARGHRAPRPEPILSYLSRPPSALHAPRALLPALSAALRCHSSSGSLLALHVCTPASPMLTPPHPTAHLMPFLEVSGEPAIGAHADISTSASHSRSPSLRQMAPHSSCHSSCPHRGSSLGNIPNASSLPPPGAPCGPKSPTPPPCPPSLSFGALELPVPLPGCSQLCVSPPPPPTLTSPWPQGHPPTPRHTVLLVRPGHGNCSVFIAVCLHFCASSAPWAECSGHTLKPQPHGDGDGIWSWDLWR